jgi:hypothetical protein
MVTFSTFNFEATRRREIERHAVLVGVAETEDFDRHLIAWAWHNPQSRDLIGALAEAARRMGGKLSEAEAGEIAEKASAYPKRIKADALGMWLGVTYRQREALKLRTIGCGDVKKRARRELRKRKARLREERRRRAQGAKPRPQSLSRIEPWKALNISRAKWYRQQKVRRETNTCAIPLSIPIHESVSGSFFSSSRSPSPSPTKPSSGRTAHLSRAHETNPCAVPRPFQAVPRPPDYDPVAAFRDRMAARQHRRRA